MPSATTIIRTLGFPDVRAFQAAWNLGHALHADGEAGPKTAAAAELSWRRHQAGQGDISPHFSAAEFRCHCHGRYSGCRGLLVLRPLLASLEDLRDHLDGVPLVVVSGYRCERWNAKVAKSDRSQHSKGSAADLRGVITVDSLRRLDLFSGIGYRKADRRVTHVDRRDASGYNPSGGTMKAPTTWIYT